MSRRSSEGTKTCLFCSMLFLALAGCIKIESSKPTFADAPANPDKSALLTLVNQYRTAGCNCGSTYYPPTSPISWNDSLEKAAKEHSDDMNAHNYFDHTGSDGTTVGERISRYGYLWFTCGENIAEGYATEKDVVEGWIKSEGHCKNIMNPAFKDMGVATAGKYWTQDFAAH